MDKKNIILLLLIASRLNTPLPVHAQEPTDEKSDLLKDSFSSDFEFTDNTSADGELLAEAGCDCCCACGCDYCLCECQCECVAHCSASSHQLPKYRFYEFLKDAYKLLVNKPAIDGRYKNDFDLNARIPKNQYKGIEYDVYTPIFNYYVSSNFTYHHINNPMTLDGNYDTDTIGINNADTTATYVNEWNTYNFYTSKYTQTVQFKIEGDAASELLTLKRDLNADGEQNTPDLTFKDADGNVITTTDPDDKIIIDFNGSAADSDAANSDIIKWTFNFKLKSYGLFTQPLPNSTYQTGYIYIVDAKDFNDVSFNDPVKKIIPPSLPADIKEILPTRVTFKVKQPKLNNLRILKVHDIYWKNWSKSYPTGISSISMPLKTNDEKRYISKGYMLGLSIDSTDYTGSQFQNIKIVPNFYHGADEVNLFYDIPNKNKYNQPLPAECTLIGVNKDDNQTYGNTGTAKKVVVKDNARSKAGKEVVKIWQFAYYLPPTTKAYLTTDTDKKHPLTGLLKVEFAITGDIDGPTTLDGSKVYDYANKPQNRGGLKSGSEVVGVFYYNLDWSALDDYSTQQKQ